MIRFRSLEDRDVVPLRKGHHYINVALHEVLVFVRKDKFFSQVKQYSQLQSLRTMNILSIVLTDTKANMNYLPKFINQNVYTIN